MKLSSYHICIEGAIGVGKTSLVKLLAVEMEAKTVLEKFEDNPFLRDFYTDRNRYAMQTQLFFLLSRYKQQQDLQQMDMFTKSIISDYMFDKDRLFAALNLSDMELDLYNRIANELQKNIVYPDLIIFLQSETDRLMYNIKIRGREIEKNMDYTYIDNLNQIYNEYFFRYEKGPLVIINTNDIDFVNNRQDLQEIIDFIKQPSEGTRYFNPIKTFK
jgi:deoxyadenosine/deoxycytidine kinase